MPATITTGFVTKALNYEDHDKIVTILTLDGFLTFIARGVRKMTSKNRHSLQLGNLIEIEFFQARLNNKMSKLKKAHTIKQIDIHHHNNADIMANILYKINQIKNPKPLIFAALNEVFPYFGFKYNHQILTYLSFMMLSSLGIASNMKNCAICHAYQDINGFNFEAGGFTCAKHTNKVKSLKILKAIQTLDHSFEKYKNVNPDLDKLIYQELINYIEQKSGMFKFG